MVTSLSEFLSGALIPIPFLPDGIRRVVELLPFASMQNVPFLIFGGTLTGTGMMQHKMSFLLTAIGQFLISFNVFLGVFFMMDRFHQVNGFTYPHVLLCFAISLSAFTLAETFFRGFDMFSTMIGNGEFDRVLLRPMGPIYQVLCSKIELTRVGRLLQSAVMLAYAIPRSQVEWTGERLLILLAMIAGGTSVFAAIFIIYASLCFLPWRDWNL